MWKPKPDTRTLEEVFNEYLSEADYSEVYSPAATWDEAKSDCYGTDRYIITQKDIEALRAGMYLRFPQNGGEYQVFIRLERAKAK